MTAAFRMIATFLLALAAGGVPAPSSAQSQAVLPQVPPVVPGLPPPADAPVAMLVDLSSRQVLHARNPDHRFAPASVTKVMTLYLAFELMDEGRLDPAQVMMMSPAIWRDWRRKGSNMRLDLGDRVLVSDLLMGIANVSANDGAAVLAEGQAGSIPAWTAAMNAKARGLGMTGSHFATPNGWPDEGRTFTTASDLITLGRALIERHPDKFRHFIGRPGFAYNGTQQINHDPLIGRIAGADGIKTGFTNESGFSYLGTARRGAQRLMLVLGGVPQSRLRGQLARNYMEWGFSAFDRRGLFADQEVIADARVQNGTLRKVPLVARGPVVINLPQGHNAPITARVEYEGPLRAPFASGTPVATLTVTSPGMVPAIIPLVAGEDVGTAGPLDRVLNGLAGWLPW